MPAVYLDKDLPEDVNTQRQQEDESETARLIYVALTRAKSHCNVMMKITPQFHRTHLFRLLFGPHIAEENELKKGISFDQARGLLYEICAGSDGNMGLVTGMPLVPARQYNYRPGVAGHLEAREFKGDMSRRWRMYSYSAIAAGMHDAHEKEDEGGTQVVRAAPDALPPGTRAGLCLHEIFENSDFTWSGRDEFRDVASGALARYGFGAKYMDYILDMVSGVLSTPLDEGGLKLSVLTSAQRLSELEFHFPLESLDGIRDFCSRSDLCSDINPAGMGPVSDLAGMMKGYIDLVFFHEGRYYIVDWKSNMLELSHGDYSRQSVLAEMKKHNYHLQYHIYTVALHRYLKLRLGTEYSYGRHFGGIYYLFIRGMTGAGEGVFHSKPEPAVIDELDRLFGGGEQK